MISVTGIIYYVQQSVEHRSSQSVSPPNGMLPQQGLAFNHLHYRHQPRTGWLSQTLRGVMAPGLCPLLHDCICNSSHAFLHCICSHFHLHHSPSPINWTCKAEFSVPCACIEEPFCMQSSSKEQDGLPWGQDHSLGICSSRPSWNMSTISDPLHVWEGGGWSPPLLE